MTSITLLQIEMFIKVAEYLSFSAAAKSMYITQPALSKSISRLEENLGVKLFQRSSHGVSLTGAGELLYAELCPSVRKINAVLDDIRNMNGIRRKNIIIGCHNAFYENGIFTRFKDAIREYETSHRDVTVLVELEEYPQLNEMLLSGEVDLIISITTSVTSAPTVSKKLDGNAEFYLVMSAAHPLASMETLDFERLENEVFYFISIDKNRNTSSELAHFKHLNFTPKRICYMPSFQSVIMAITMGRGVTLSGYFDTRHKSSNLKFFPVPEAPEPPRIVIAWRTDDIKSYAKALVDML
ncbi:MAG: LysR family transcriptional regulator [Oscillospiraceae bacterium]|jgi:DNA-binding transcriptional LysR family regulator|nr:LysR family transcriptional regulator [Oscillospiraceae bacterium]